jgi:hypothetical protein
MYLFIEHQHNLNPLKLDPEVLGKAIHFLFTNYEIQFNGKIYLQVKGAPMGARSSVALAIITMHHIEKLALMKVKDITDIVIYGRYVDDILIVAKNHKDNKVDIPDETLKAFNNVHPSIQFTIEAPDKKDWLPFLDLQIKFEHDKILTKWYQKGSHSGNIIHTSSHGPPDTKTNCMTNFFRIILDRCNTNEGINEGLNIMVSEMRHNGYGDDVIRKCLKKAICKHNDKDATLPAKLDKWENNIPLRCSFINNKAHFMNKKIITECGLPFVHVMERNNKISTIGEKVKESCRENCKTCEVQEKPDCLAKICNYIATCKACGEEYIGKSDRRLQDRIKEHMTEVAHHRDDKSAIAHHSINEHFDIIDGEFKNLFEFKILKRNTDEPNNSISEALYITKTDPSINRKHEDLLRGRRWAQKLKDNYLYNVRFKG